MTAPADYDPSRFPPFAVTVDIVVFTVQDGRLLVALVERRNEPFKGTWALPGGFVQPDEDLRSAAARELTEETGLHSPHLEQFGAYGDPDRDPRMRVVTVGYWAIVADPGVPEGGSDAAAAELVEVGEALDAPGSLAFDHHTILSDALERARQALENTTAATAFCPPEFTISELRAVYEAVWGISVDPANFANKATEIPGFVVPVGRRRRSGRGRPPELFRAGSAELIDPPFRRPRAPGNS